MPSCERADQSSGIGRDGLAIVGDAVFVSHIQHQVMGDDGIALAIARIDLLNFREPRIGGPVRQNFDGGVDGHGIERVRRELQRLIRLRGGQLGVGVLEHQIGHQFVRFHQLGIELDRLRVILDCLVVKAVRAHQRQADIGRRVVRIDFESFVEKIFGVGCC